VTSAPIGVFDSGVGGLTVARAILDQLPGERVRYVGDTANGPYGPLAIDEVLHHAMAVADRLVASGVKILVIACNTASAAGAYDEAVRRYDIPVVEVIRPAVRRAVSVTKSGEVGVIGTSATIASGAYQAAFADTSDVLVRAQACPSFVDFVERGVTSGRQVLGLAQAYLSPLQRTAVDTVVLGCTHYPLLTGVLQLVMGPGVSLVSSAEETAKDVYRLLTEADLLADPMAAPDPHEFSATGDPAAFERLGRRFLGPEMTAVSTVSLAG
jgi:glutamate racemase